MIFSTINQIPDFLFEEVPHMDLLTSLNTNTRDDSANNQETRKGEKNYLTRSFGKFYIEATTKSKAHTSQNSNGKAHTSQYLQVKNETTLQKNQI